MDIQIVIDVIQLFNIDGLLFLTAIVIVLFYWVFGAYGRYYALHAQLLDIQGCTEICISCEAPWQVFIVFIK